MTVVAPTSESFTESEARRTAVVTPLRASDYLSVDTRPFTFSEVREARNQRSLARVATIVGVIASVVTLASAVAVVLVH